MKNYYLPASDVVYFSNGKQRFKHSPIYIDYLEDHRRSGSHWHDYTQIWYTVSGSYEHTINGEKRIQHPGDVAIVFPYSVHEINSLNSDLEKTKVISLSISTEAIEKHFPLYSPLTYNLAFYDKLPLSCFVSLHEKNKERADEILLTLSSAVLKREPLSQQKVFQNIDIFLQMCISPKDISSRQISTLEAHSEFIRYASNFTIDNLSSHLSVNTVCSKANMSPRLFVTSFKNITGQTYHSFLLNLRLQLALDDLQYTDRLLYEIAKNYGFSHSSHLVHVCNRYVDMSPSDFRNNYKTRKEDFGHIQKWRMQRLKELSENIGEILTE